MEITMQQHKMLNEYKVGDVIHDDTGTYLVFQQFSSGKYGMVELVTGMATPLYVSLEDMFLEASHRNEFLVKAELSVKEAD